MNDDNHPVLWERQHVVLSSAGIFAGCLFWLTNRVEFHDDAKLEAGADEHLFSTDVKSIADVSAHKREGGKILKHKLAQLREKSGYDALGGDTINAETYDWIK